MISDSDKLAIVGSSLSESYKQVKAVFDASLCVSIIATNTEGLITFFNKGAEHLLGYRSDEVVNRLTPAVLHDLSEVESRAKELTIELGYEVTGFETFVAYAKNGLYEEREWTYIAKDRTRKMVQLSVTAIHDDNQSIAGFLGTAIDISARKEVEAKLRTSEQLFRRLFDDSGDALLLIIDGVFVDCNELTVRMLRATTKHDVLNCNPADLSPEFQLDGLRSDKKAGEMMSLAFEKGYHRFEWLHRRLDGTVFPVEVLLTAITINEKKVLHTCWRDISDRKEQEEKLRQSQKMEVVGQLAGGVAHDFNNMLSSILGSADILIDEVAGNANSTELVKTIIHSAERASALTKQLLSFARKGEQNLSILNVNEILVSVETILEHTIDKNISISLNLSTSRSFIRGDQTQIENALLNLGLNARDSMPNGGSISFSTTPIVLSKPKQYVGGFELAAGEYIGVDVSDCGSGIPKELLTKIFEPFFTTKPLGKGTGLGLASVYGTVKSHHGAVYCTSVEQKGTTFHLLFPIENTEHLNNSELLPKTAPHGSATILLADDEELVRNTLQRMLEVLGYTVIPAGDGLEAIEIYENRGSEIDIVILGMIMPQMKGSTVFRHLRTIDEAVKVVIVSGYTEDESIQELMHEGLAGFIEKPFRKTDVALRVSEIIHK